MLRFLRGRPPPAGADRRGPPDVPPPELSLPSLLDRAAAAPPGRRAEVALALAGAAAPDPAELAPLADAVRAWARGGPFGDVRRAADALPPSRAADAPAARLVDAAAEACRFARDAARWAARIAEQGDAGAGGSDSTPDQLVASYALSALRARGVDGGDGMARLAAAARAALGAA